MFVKVPFKSAKLVIEGNDKVFDLVVNPDGKINKKMSISDRNNFVDINKPICFEQVSNMLHVLFGERPVPTYRTTIRKRVSEIDKIASTGFYKITNIFQYISKDGNNAPIKEFTQGKKNQYNSHLKSYTNSKFGVITGNISWSILRKRYKGFDTKKYDEVINKIKLWCNDENVEKNMCLTDALFKIKNSAFKDDACVFFENNSLTPFSNLISGVNLDISDFNRSTSKFATRTINVSPTTKITLNGEFLFELSDEEYLNLLKGPLVANFLDGGYAEVICERLDACEVDLDEYVKL